jgi:hypothetical protein
MAISLDSTLMFDRFRRRVANPNPRGWRGIMTTNTYRGSNARPYAGSLLGAAAKTGQVAVAISGDTEIVMRGYFPKYHGYNTLAAIQTAAQVACQNASAKFFTSSLSGTAPFSASLGVLGITGIGTAVPSTPVWGWKVKVAASLTNFSFAPININIVDSITTAAGAISALGNTVTSFTVMPNRNPMEILVLSTAPGSSYASLSTGSIGATLASSATTLGNFIQVVPGSASTDIVTIEGLNARDLMVTGNANARVYDREEEDDNLNLFPTDFVGDDTAAAGIR